MNSKMADSLCLRYAKEHNFVLPSTNRNERETFKGGFVQNSIPGLHKNIACMDMKSLYPSIMIGFNASYETILECPTENCLNGNDKYYFRREKGIIPAIIKPLLERREIVKKEMKQIEDSNSREFKSKFMEQYTLKTIANSFYGVLGYPSFRLYKREVAEAVTYLSRMTIKEVTKWFNEKNLKVIYGDTDSVFVEMHIKTVEEFKILTKEINIYLRSFFNGFGVREEDNIIELQFEKVYNTIFFKGIEGKGIKKKYAGILIWEDGKDCYKFQRRGFESRRSDNSKVGRKFLDDFLKIIIGVSAGIFILVLYIFIKRELFDSRFIVLAGWFFAIIFILIGRFFIINLQKILMKK